MNALAVIVVVLCLMALAKLVGLWLADIRRHEEASQEISYRASLLGKDRPQHHQGAGEDQNEAE